MLVVGSAQRVIAQEGAAPNRVLIKYADPSASGASRGLQGLEIVPLDDDEPMGDALERLNARPDILFAEPDHRVTALRVPSDLRWNLQWGPRTANLPPAWEVTTGEGREGGTHPPDTLT